MRRTLNEVYGACRKAAEGAGAPRGLDIDAAEAAVWLLARGLARLDRFAAELEIMAGGHAVCAPAATGEDKDPPALDASAKAGVLIAPALVDLLVAEAMADGRAARMAVTGLSAPLFLLPSAARYAEDGWNFRFTLSDAAGHRFVLTASAEAGVAVAGPADAVPAAQTLSNAGTFDLDLLCARANDTAPPADTAGLVVLADAASLDRRAAASLAEGIEIEARTWDRLRPFVALTLVPATDESRRRGAGSRLGDNE